MLDLNNDEIKEEGSSGSFDPSKIFGFSVIEDNVIVKTLEGVLVSGFDTGESSTGSKYFDIKLTDSNGNESNMREYEPDASRDDYARKCKSQQTRLKHILTKFVPEGTALPAAATFPELWDGIKNMLTVNACNTKPVRLKLVYNNKGFLTVPPYVPFMELMSVPTADSKLNLNPGFDALTRPEADTPQEMMTDASTDESDESDDLPF